MVEGEYIVPYSSHSNYKEIDMFVNSLRPAVLKCVVREVRSNYQKIGNVKQFNSYMFTLQSLRQTGYELLLKKYTDVNSASLEYMDMMQPAIMDDINQKLGLKITEAKAFEEDTRRFDTQMSQILKARNKNKLTKGVKLKKPEENEELTIEDVEFIRKCKEQENSTGIRESSIINDSAKENQLSKNTDVDIYAKPLTKTKLNMPVIIKEHYVPDVIVSHADTDADEAKPVEPSKIAKEIAENQDFDDEFK